MLNNKAESKRKKGKGRAQITVKSTESRTKRVRHRKNSGNTPKSSRKKGKGRAQITARSTEYRTKRARHRKNSSNTRRTTAVTAEASKDECGEKTTKRRNDVHRKGRKRWQGDTD